MVVKPRTNYVMDIIILVLFVVVLASGLLLWQAYPESGTHHRGGRGDTAIEKSVLGIAKSDMRAVHDWAGVLMGVFVAVHLLFHWKWIVCQTRKALGLPLHPQRIAPKQIK